MKTVLDIQAEQLATNKSSDPEAKLRRFIATSLARNEANEAVEKKKLQKRMRQKLKRSMK